MTALAAVVGLVIGATLGALGGGGAVLTVPALVYLLGESVAAATTTSLVVVGGTAVAGALAHARSDNVRWRAGLGFGLSGLAAAYLGGRLVHGVDGDLLMLGFAVVLLVAAAGMLIPGRREPAVGRPRSRPLVAAKVVAAGLVVGMLTGLFGVGGGFVVVPALVLLLGFEMPAAVGTSLVVVAMNSLVALAARIGHVSVDWSVAAPLLGCALVGAAGGRWVGGRLSSHTLTRAFGVLLLLVAAGVGTTSAAALA